MVEDFLSPADAKGRDSMARLISREKLSKKARKELGALPPAWLLIILSPYSSAAEACPRGLARPFGMLNFAI